MTEQELKTRMEALLAKQQSCLRVQKLLPLLCWAMA